MKILTKDLFEASYFLSKGLPLEQILGDRQKILFQFEGGDSLQALKKQWDNGDAFANVHKFKESLNHLKDIMFSRIREEQSAFASHV